ncbi:unnamed protein product, partial [marine sediment metagenome]
DSWGKYPMHINPGSYVILIKKSGYVPQQVVFNTASDENEIFVNLEQQSMVSDKENLANNNPDVSNEDPTVVKIDNSSIDFPSTIKEGTIFQLPNIYYNFNDASIRPDAKIDLDALASFLITYPDIEIELSSHTDSRGGTRYNRQLSQGRAENAVKYLVTKGINKSRMIAVGYGESQLRNKCRDGIRCSELEHQYNRRTEVKITKMSQEINIEFVNDDKMPDNYTSIDPNNSDSSKTKVPSDNTAKNSDDYNVIAGVYREKANAEKKLKKLKKFGYDAQILVTGNSGTHSVVVGTYSSQSAAQSIVNTLKREYKIRAFIKK